MVKTRFPIDFPLRLETIPTSLITAIHVPGMALKGQRLRRNNDACSFLLLGKTKRKEYKRIFAIVFHGNGNWLRIVRMLVVSNFTNWELTKQTVVHRQKIGKQCHVYVIPIPSPKIKGPKWGIFHTSQIGVNPLLKTMVSAGQMGWNHQFLPPLGNG